MTIHTRDTQTSTLLYELQQLLIQIKTCNDTNDSESSRSVGNLTSHALRLLHYAVFALENQQTALPLTSVSASAALYEVAQELQPLAQSYGATIGFEASAHLDPIYAHELSLKGCMFALLSGILTAGSNGVQPHITVAIQQTRPKEQRIGVYSNTTQLSPSMLRMSRRTNHMSRMDVTGRSHRSGLGFLVTRILSERMNATLQSFEHNTTPGIGFYMPESAQLTLL